MNIHWNIFTPVQTNYAVKHYDENDIILGNNISYIYIILLVLVRFESTAIFRGHLIKELLNIITYYVKYMFVAL